MERRKFLAAAGTGMLVGVAGCNSESGESGDPTSANPPGESSDFQVPPPEADLPDGWELKTSDTEPHVLLEDSRLGVDYKAIGHSRRFEDTALRERVRKELFGRFDRALVVGFASHVDLEVLGGNLTESFVLKATDKIQNEAESAFRAQMKEFGLQNISKIDPYQAQGNRSPSEFQRFTASYSVDSVEIDDVDIPNIEEESFRLGSGQLEVAGLLATHQRDDEILVTGGMYPNENYTRSKEWEITGGVDLDLTVDLGLRPNLHRSDIVNFARNVYV